MMLSRGRNDTGSGGYGSGGGTDPRNPQEQSDAEQAAMHNRAFERNYYATHPGAPPGSYNPARSVVPASGPANGGASGTEGSRAIAVAGVQGPPDASGNPTTLEPGTILQDRRDELMQQYNQQDRSLHEINGRLYGGEALAVKLLQSEQQAGKSSSPAQKKYAIYDLGNGTGIELPFPMSESTAKSFVDRLFETERGRELDYEQKLGESKATKEAQDNLIVAAGGKKVLWGGAFEGSPVEYYLPQPGDVKVGTPTVADRTYTKVIWHSPFGNIDIRKIFSPGDNSRETVKNIADAYKYQLEEDYLKAKAQWLNPLAVPQPSVVNPNATQKAQMSAEEFKQYQAQGLAQLDTEKGIALSKISGWSQLQQDKISGLGKLGIAGVGYDSVEGLYFHPDDFKAAAQNAPKPSVSDAALMATGVGSIVVGQKYLSALNPQLELGEKGQIVAEGLNIGGILGLSIFNPGIATVSGKVWELAKLVGMATIQQPAGQLINLESGGRIPEWLGGLAAGGVLYFGLSASEGFLFPSSTKVVGASLRDTEVAGERSISSHQVGAAGDSIFAEGGSWSKFKGAAPAGKSVAGAGAETFGEGYNVRVTNALGTKTTHITGKEVQFVSKGEVFTVGEWEVTGKRFFNLIKTKAQGFTSFSGKAKPIASGIGEKVPLGWRMGGDRVLTTEKSIGGVGESVGKDMSMHLWKSYEAPTLSGRLADGSRMNFTLGHDLPAKSSNMDARLYSPVGRNLGYDTQLSGSLKTRMGGGRWTSEDLQMGYGSKSKVIDMQLGKVGKSNKIEVVSQTVSGKEVAGVDQITLVNKKIVDTKITKESSIRLKYHLEDLNFNLNNPKNIGRSIVSKQEGSILSSKNIGETVGYPVSDYRGAINNLDEGFIKAGEITPGAMKPRSSPTSTKPIVMDSWYHKPTGTIKEVIKDTTTKLEQTESNRAFPKVKGSYGIRARFLERIQKVESFGSAKEESPFTLIIKKSNRMKNFAEPSVDDFVWQTEDVTKISGAGGGKVGKGWVDAHSLESVGSSDEAMGGSGLLSKFAKNSMPRSFTARSVESMGGMAASRVDVSESLASSLLTSGRLSNVHQEISSFTYHSPFSGQESILLGLSDVSKPSRSRRGTVSSLRQDSLNDVRQRSDQIPILDSMSDSALMSQQRSEQVLRSGLIQDQLSLQETRLDNLPLNKPLPYAGNVPPPPFGVGFPGPGPLGLPGGGGGGGMRGFSKRRWGEVSDILEPGEMSSSLLGTLGTTRRRRKRK
jgi:hypothetical protein